MKKEGRGDEGMGLTTITSGGVGEEWDDDQTKWGAEDGTSTMTRNNHQMVKRRWGRAKKVNGNGRGRESAIPR